MNLWGFAEAMLDELDAALDAFDPATAPHAEGKPPELLLPDVVGRARRQKAGRRSASSRRTVVASGSPTPTICPSSAALIAEGLAG